MTGLEEVREGDLIAAADARQLLPVSKSHFYRLVNAGRIPAVRLRSLGHGPGRIFVWRHDLERFLRELPPAHQREEAPPPGSLDLDAILRRVKDGD